jgi:hypothetical protein
MSKNCIKKVIPRHITKEFDTLLSHKMYKVVCSTRSILKSNVLFNKGTASTIFDVDKENYFAESVSIPQFEVDLSNADKKVNCHRHLESVCLEFALTHVGYVTQICCCYFFVTW